MERPDIVVRGLSLSDAQTANLEERADRLTQYFPRILRCRVAVEGPGGHHRLGRYRVRLEVGVPGDDIVISRQPGEDLDEAIHRAFNAAERRLADELRQMRGRVKLHRPARVARIARVFHERGYGFLEDADGRDVYFHQNSVANAGFHRLEAGMIVRYAEVPGIDGPQASAVRVLRRRPAQEGRASGRRLSQRPAGTAVRATRRTRTGQGA